MIIFIPTAVPPVPVLGQPNCSSRHCVLQVQQSIATRHLQVEYRTDTLRWTSNHESVRNDNGTDFAIECSQFPSGPLKCCGAQVTCKLCGYECEDGFPKTSIGIALIVYTSFLEHHCRIIDRHLAAKQQKGKKLQNSRTTHIATEMNHLASLQSLLVTLRIALNFMLVWLLQQVFSFHVKNKYKNH